MRPSTTTSNSHITLEAQVLRVVVLNINLFSFYFRNKAKWKACWPWQQCLMGVINMKQQVSDKRFLKKIICEIYFWILRLYPLKLTISVFSSCYESDWLFCTSGLQIMHGTESVNYSRINRPVTFALGSSIWIAEYFSPHDFLKHAHACIWSQNQSSKYVSVCIYSGCMCLCE